MALPADANQNYVSLRTGIMFLVLGLGEINGSYFSGRFSDKLSIRKVGAIALSAYIIAVSMSILAVTYNNTVVPVMISAFFWGFM